MQTILIKARMREKSEKLIASAKKSIKAILYGKNVENKMLWIDYQEFRKAYEAVGESTVVDLAIEGNGANHKVLIHDVQLDPVTDEFRHIDFFEVKMDEEITTEVEIEFVGESSAVKELGGVLVKNLDSVEVTSLPGDLPNIITVDVAAIKTFEDYIYVKDLKVSDKVKILADPETVVALVSPPRTQEELEQLNEKVEVDIEQVAGMKKEVSEKKAE
jgi:large subunit ribosomal protein L25